MYSLPDNQESMISLFTWLARNHPFGVARVCSAVVLKPLVDGSVCGVGSAFTSAPGPRGTALFYDQTLERMVIPGLLSLPLLLWKLHPIKNPAWGNQAPLFLAWYTWVNLHPMNRGCVGKRAQVLAHLELHFHNTRQDRTSDAMTCLPPQGKQQPRLGAEGVSPNSLLHLPRVELSSH